MSVNTKNRLAAAATALTVLVLLAVLQMSSTHAAARGPRDADSIHAVSQDMPRQGIPDGRLVEYQ